MKAGWSKCQRIACGKAFKQATIVTQVFYYIRFLQLQASGKGNEQEKEGRVKGKVGNGAVLLIGRTFCF